VSLVQPFVESLEALVYDGLCGLSSLFHIDGDDSNRHDILSSPDPGAPRRMRGR
jgi:hypothetical protein